jgi:fructose-1,6-bisphosphatase I
MEGDPIISLSAFAKKNSPELTDFLVHLARAGKKIAAAARRSGLTHLLGATGEVNVQGEEVQKLDVYSNDVFIKSFQESETVGGYASEENEKILDYEKSAGKAPYLVSFDPLDGSGNIDVNASFGSIFSVLKRKTSSGTLTEDDFLQPGRSQAAAGYLLYGPGTMLVYATSKGVNGFTLDPERGEFILSHPDLRLPEMGKVYSLNESYSDAWSAEISKYVNRLKRGEGIKTHSARYMGALVADFHRILLKGGIFLYPATAKNPGGKVRLLYECSPMAYVASQAGGMASDGKRDILDIVPEKLHQRTPFFVGSKTDVELLTELMG